MQVQRTKTAAQAATEAANNVKSRVAVFDAVSEISLGIAYLHETEKHLRNGSWESVVDSYSAVRTALTRLVELSSGIDDAQRSKIRSMLTDIASLCEQIDNGMTAEQKTLQKARALKKARSYSDLLEAVKVRFNKVAI